MARLRRLRAGPEARREAASRAGREAASRAGCGAASRTPRAGLRGGGRADLVDVAPGAAVAALVAVALDLAREVVGGLVDRVGHARRRASRAQGHALEAQRALHYLTFLDRRVALLAQL